MQPCCFIRRLLSTGMTQRAISHSFGIAQPTVHQILLETAAAIFKALKTEYLPIPTENVWKNNARTFEEKWNFPNCVGAIDGKHVQIQVNIQSALCECMKCLGTQCSSKCTAYLLCNNIWLIKLQKPPNGGSRWINYNGTHSIVLMAIASADYTFSYIDVGGYGRQSDGGTWKASSIGRALNDGTLALPPPRIIEGVAKLMPYVFVAGAAFPLSTNLLRPYPGFKSQNMRREQRIFNYR